MTELSKYLIKGNEITETQKYKKYRNIRNTAILNSFSVVLSRPLPRLVLHTLWSPLGFYALPRACKNVLKGTLAPILPLAP